MEIKHEHIQCVLLAWAAEVGQAHAANAITAEYLRLGGDQLPLVAGNTWNNQQNIFHRWLNGRTAQRREKIRLLLPAILVVLPRAIRHRLSIYDTLERRALLAAQDALGAAIDAHDDAVEAVYRRAQHSAADSPKFH
ncbi:toxin YdaT family protein [Lelliottia wanjuensis]|uniref:Toxin YdaT family protein n=1 Tax=Lelliottia wanjuensis TaxID=3050585 RepID=A0AAP4D6G0_9ENTR|nr:MULTISPECIES: toxin YdaT family protein [unclassified Lelliottia]MDK9364202.1 toxin YdaT family protein [Lelliottia sp. V106_12]MDK9617121.1 toxin YdaT family protein [Lelliottia sp. V106_9]